ncbi:MAG: acyltransferase [Promethearchaeota archaeon]
MKDPIKYGQVEIGEGVIIQDYVVLGKKPERAKISLFSKEEKKFNPTKIGNYVTICTGAVVFAGVEIGDNAFIGDGASIRENTVIGGNTIVGRAVTIECNTVIGKNCKIETGAHVTGNCTVGDDVFIGPFVVTTNDRYLALVDVEMVGPTFDDGCAIGANSTILPGVHVGKKAIVGAGSLVIKDVPDEEVWMGNPARKVGTYKKFIATSKLFKKTKNI